MLTGPKVAYEEYQQVVGELREEIEALTSELERLRAAQVATTSWMESVRARRITVHCLNGSSIDGSLTATMDDGVILRAAQLLNPDQTTTPMAGEVFIPRINVAFVQLDE